MINVKTKEFQCIQKLMYDQTGVHLRDCKTALVNNRLRKRLAVHGFDNFQDYCDLLMNSPAGKKELIEFVDALTTNETYFFRNPEHFDYIHDTIVPELMQQQKAKGVKTLSIWCAACSSGEEPYSLAITFQERPALYRSWNITIIGTDISNAMIQRARQGVFKPYAVAKMPASLKKKYFRYDAEEDLYTLTDEIRDKVSFHCRNLLKPFPYGTMDIILCRNAMIYFNKESKQIVAENLYQALESNGYLVVGYADNFIQSRTELKYIQPTVFKKEQSTMETKRLGRGHNE
ncbi:protein-glutamate O-methyltransferase CheR [bacterium]|nr:protein-glutamate O-methyltransferase CheR [bacterium]